MSIFAVLFDKDQALTNEQIKKIDNLSSQKPFKVNDGAFLITSDGLSSDISESLGMNKAEGVTGVVLKLNAARQGWFSAEIWEWFNKAEGLSDE